MSNDGPTPPLPPNPYGAQQPPPQGPPPPQASHPMPTPPPGGNLAPAAASSKGFFGALFDFSFTHFVTPMIVKVVYVLATIALGLSWLVFLVAGFSANAGLGVVVLVLGPIAVVIYLALIRMTLEFYLALVRMSEDIHKRLPG